MADIKLKFESSNSNVELGKGYIEKITSVSRKTSNPSGIYYGSIESSGDVVVYDRNKSILSKINEGELGVDNTPLSISINGNVVQNHLSSDNDYDNVDNKFTMSLGNNINDWSYLRYRGFKYQEKQETAYAVLYDIMNCLHGEVWTNSSKFDSMLTKKIIWGKLNKFSSVKDYLMDIKIPVPKIDGGKTYREVIDDFCRLVQLQVYVDDNNNIVFDSARPVTSNTNVSHIVVNPSNMFSELKFTAIPKNKYTHLEMNSVSVIEEIEPKTSVYSGTTSSSLVDSVYTNVVPYSFVSEDAEAGSVGNSYAKLSLYYYTGDIIIKKNSEDNLSKILGILTGTDENGYPFISHSVDYTYNTGSVVLGGMVGQEQYFPQYSKSSKGSGILATYGTISAKQTSSVVASLSDKTNLKKPTITDNGDYFTVSYKVLVGWEKLTVTATGGIQTSSSAEEYWPNALNISVLGIKRSINLKQTDFSSLGVETSRLKTSISTSSLFQSGTKFTSGGDFLEEFKTNILSDYSLGVKDAKITVSCSNYYDQFGNLVYDWSKGEILRVGDFIKIYGSNILWRIERREFVYEAKPLLILELVEIRQVEEEPFFGLKNSSGEVLYFWEDLLSEGIVTENNGVLTTVDENRLDGYLFVSKEINRIENDAFYNASKLKGITLYSGLQSIGYGAFENSGLSSITIPDTVTSIGTNPFIGCKSLTAINVSPYNTVYTSRDNCNAIIESSTKTLVCGCKTSVIPNDVENLGAYAFDGVDISSIFIPNGVKTIGARCFEGSSIVEINMPDTITSVGEFAFHHCEKLSNVKLSSSLKNIGYHVFSYCYSLVGHFKIPSTVTSLEQQAFAYCTGLTSVFVPRSITFITTGRPFNGCSPNMIIYTDIADGMTATNTIPSLGWTYDWNAYNSLGDKLITLYGAGYYPDNILIGTYTNTESVDNYFDKKLYVQTISDEYLNYRNTYCYKWNSGVGFNPIQEYTYRAYFYKVNDSSFKIFFDPEQNVSPKTFSVSTPYVITDSETGEVYTHSSYSGGGGNPPVVGPIIPM